MRRAFLLLPLLMSAAAKAIGQTRATITQIKPPPQAQPDAVLLVVIGGRISTAKVGAGVQIEQGPAGLMLTAASTAYQFGQAAAIQTDGSFIVPQTPARIVQVFRNGLLQQQDTDYSIDPANKARIVPSASYESWSAADIVQASCQP